MKRLIVRHKGQNLAVDPVVADARELVNGQSVTDSELSKIIRDNAKVALAEIEARNILDKK